MSNVDMTMKVVNYPNVTTYLQCEWFDDTRCLVTVNMFHKGAVGQTEPLLHTGFYVPRRGVEGGIAWDIDVLPKVQAMAEGYTHES
jgi:hypothetical protein